MLETGRSKLISELTPEMIAAAAEDEQHRAMLMQLGMRSVITVPLQARGGVLGVLSLGSREHERAVRELAPRSAMIVPLNSRGRAVGAIALVTTEDSGRHYDPQDLELAVELASRTALLVDNARLYAEATAAVSARDDMIQLVSHDLRNPLQSISTVAALLQLDAPPERRAKGVESITLATSQMNRLLQDLLDISQMDVGRFSVTPEAVDAASLIEETHTSNFVGNALKFVPGGGEITISADLDGERVRLAVSDTGVGLSRDDQDPVFERFWRGDRRKERGAGLGLAVAKGIVEAHRGEIGVDSVKVAAALFTSCSMPLFRRLRANPYRAARLPFSWSTTSRAAGHDDAQRTGDSTH